MKYMEGNNIYSFIRKSLWCCFLLTGLLLSALTVKAEESTRNIVRVGYIIETEGTKEKEPQESMGYEYEYLVKIAQYANWDYEFVGVRGDKESATIKLLEMLEDGEIDILGSMEANEYNQEHFNLTGCSYGHIHNTIAVASKNPTYNELNYRSLSRIRIAVPNDVDKFQQMSRYFTQNGIPFTFLRYDTKEQMKQALENSEVDAVLWSEEDPIDETKVVIRFGEIPYYFGTTRGNTDVLNGLNAALNKISEVDPYFEARLRNKYFNFMVSTIQLTQAEKNFISNNPVLKVAIPSGTAPLQYINEKGEFKGITRGILNKITEQTGLTFEFVESKSMEENLKIIQEKSADIICSIPYQQAINAYSQMNLTRPYLEADTVLYCNKGIDSGDLSGKICALLEGDEVPNGVDEKDIHYYQSIQDCIAAVDKGKADYGYSNEFSITYYTTVNDYKNIIIIPGSVETGEYCMGLVNGDPFLASIINKSISSIDDSQLQTMILSATTEFDRKISAESLLYTYGLQITVITVIVFIVLTAGLIHIDRGRKKSKVQNRIYEQLAELTNEYMYEYDAESDKISFSSNCRRLLQITEKKLKYSETKPPVSLLLQGIDIKKGTEQEPQEIDITMPDGKTESFRVMNSVLTGTNQKSWYVLGKLVNISKEKAEKQALISRAQMDGLTGIYNAITTKELIINYLAKMSANEHVVIILMDVDHFKQVNDTLGHYTGDNALIKVADTLQGVFRTSDIVGRVGGDEFCICMIHNPVGKSIVSRCEKILKKLNYWINVDEREVEVSVSMGVISVAKGEEFADAYQRADKLLYESKKAGGNQATYSL